MKTTTPHIETLPETSGALWACGAGASGVSLAFTAPRIEIEGRLAEADPGSLKFVAKGEAPGPGMRELRYRAALTGMPEAALDLVVRLCEKSPVIRFRYEVSAVRPLRLTRTAGGEPLRYFGLPLSAWPTAKEIQLSQFNDLVHSYCPLETDLGEADFDAGLQVMGPILAAGNGNASCLVAYEHGSTVPDAFLAFRLGPDRTVTLEGVKGNVCPGEEIGPGRPWRTVWFEAAIVEGDESALARAYRAFVLRHLCPNQASREPYIFYNTWAFQERNKWWNGKKYLDSMTQERILAEIDVAHRMGIDVFVLDTGWYDKTGDWRVNRQRFPDGLKAVRERLENYGMRLGLWFGPTHAAVSSQFLKTHGDCLMEWRGKVSPPHPVWESEESRNLCLVSRYGEAFAAEMIRLVREVGVTYFKWDAVGQYGCDGAGHGHGSHEHTPEERAESYAFELPGAMARIVNRLCAACPEAIVDFDVTERGRCVGLSFLAAGKFFLINNGPYYSDYDIPYERSSGLWSNIFVHPGPARGWICRTPLAYDKWIPSVLFLTHYLPDDPEESQLINIASLILGQNGIWGDLLALSDEGLRRFGTLLRLYKQVRYEITGSDPVRHGTIGGCLEIHEKLSADTGKGAVVAFSSSGGRFRSVLRNRVHAQHAATAGATVERLVDGRAVITWDFAGRGAKIVFFGAQETDDDKPRNGGGDRGGETGDR